MVRAGYSDEFAPGDDCYIDATRFETPQELARFLVSLAGDDAAYARYLQWKSRPLRAQFLRMIERNADDEFHRLAARLRAVRASRITPRDC